MRVKTYSTYPHSFSSGTNGEKQTEDHPKMAIKTGVGIYTASQEKIHDIFISYLLFFCKIAT